MRKNFTISCLVAAALATVAVNASSVHAGWIGATTGTTNDAGHSYNANANWTSTPKPNPTFSPALTGPATYYVSATLTNSGDWTITPTGDFALTLTGGGTVSAAGNSVTAADRTVTLGGNVVVNANGAGAQTVTLGSTVDNNKLNIALGGTNRSISVATGDALVILNTISGANAFTKTGAGTLTLSGNNTSGSTIVTDGTLIVTHANSLGAAINYLQLKGANANVQFEVDSLQHTGDLNLQVSGGTISGPGLAYFGKLHIGNLGGMTLNVDTGASVSVSGLSAANAGRTQTKGGEGTLILRGEAYTPSDFVLSAGVVALGHDGSFGTSQTTFLNGGTIAATGGARNITNALMSIGGNVAFGNATYADTLTFSNTTATELNTTSGVVTHTLTTNVNTTFANGFKQTGAGAASLTKDGTATLTIGGTSTYTGTTTVNDGTLRVNGILDNTGSTLTVGNNGALGGTGTINRAVTINAGGIHAAGNSIGTQNVGTYTVAGTEQVELGTPGATAPAGLSDRTVVTGNLTLSTGSTLQLIDNAGANSQGSMGAGAYRLLTFTGNRTGTFTNVINPLSASFHADVSYNGTSNGSVDLALNEYAAPAFELLSGADALTNNTTQASTYLLTFTSASGAGSSSLSLHNLLINAGFQDSLTGEFDLTGLNVFTAGGFTNGFTALATGDTLTGLTVGFTGLSTGSYIGVIIYTPTSRIGSGDATMSSVQLNLLANVTAIPEPASLALLVAGSLLLLPRTRRNQA